MRLTWPWAFRLITVALGAVGLICFGVWGMLLCLGAFFVGLVCGALDEALKSPRR